MELTSPELGALAELRFQQRCLERGIGCFSPVIGNNKAIDFVIRLEGRFVSVQVKKATVTTLANGGKCSPRLQVRTNDTRYNKYKEKPDQSLFDFYAFVCLELNSVWLFPAAEVNKITWSCMVKDLAKHHDYLF